MTGETRVRLEAGPVVPGHRVQHNAPHHLLVIDHAIVPCTPTEYALLLYLLHHIGESIPFATLLALLHTHPQSDAEEQKESSEQHRQEEHQRSDRQARRLLTQHMSRLRAKLWPLGLDILCLVGHGYVLHATTLPPE